ncbi:MAG TPA: DNA polymerase I [Chitinophagales bacterium]|nr:DNA polymerase I [Chitinophagales bacterium]
MADKRLFLLDAFALIYRAYFALGKTPLYNSKGMNTAAVFGFTNTLVDLIQREKPTHIAVCFDTAAPTKRGEEFTEYKANRQEQPEDITVAIPYIRKIIEAFKIPIVECDGYEADDVIGTLAKKAEKDGYKVYMVTPDKDYGQLVSENIFMYKPAYQGRPVEVLGTEEIKAKWEIDDVLKVIDILGLMGDSVDNIPGLPGVGEKTAKKLIQEFGSIENLIVNTDKLKGKLQQTVVDNKDLALLSKKLATIDLEVPCGADEDRLIMEDPDKEKLTELFAELEFRTLGKRIIGDQYSVLASEGKQKNLFGEVVESKTATPDAGAAIQTEKTPLEKSAKNTPHQYFLVDTQEKIIDLVSKLQQQKEFCFDTETTHVDANLSELVGLAFSFNKHEGYYVPVPEDRNEALKIVAHFKSLLADETKVKIGQNIKYDMLVLKWYDVEVSEPLFDTMLAHFVIEPDARHNMDILAENFLRYETIHIEELIGKKGKGQGNMRDAAVEKVAEYSGEDSDITLQLKEVFVPMLKEKEVEKLFSEIEVPLVPVLADMEFEGVKIDKEFLNEYSRQMQKEIDQVEGEVYNLAGVKFNLASPKQLGDVLFEKMKIPYIGKKTKTGQYSTDDDILTKLAREFAIAKKIQDHREWSKLKSTYVDALPSLINPKTGRVHTSFNQAIAATGRLSSVDPNLQNIPIRTDRGKEIRKAFIARDDEHVLLSCDYSQIELRIIASLSEDANMIQAFKDGIDIHSATAAKVFGVELDMVTSDMRRNAKAVNFGIAYGQTAFGLSQGLGISRTEAQEIITNHQKQFPGVSRLMATNIQFARDHGYVTTIKGRKRYLRDINSANQTVRGQAERLAINSPIQGSAADMIKLAMINIHREFQKRKFKTKMTLQVHDELVFDVYQPELDAVKEIVLEKMKTAIELIVPVDVGSGVGKNWLDAH